VRSRTIRCSTRPCAYALQKLTESGELEPIARCHTKYHRASFKRAEANEKYNVPMSGRRITGPGRSGSVTGVPAAVGEGGRFTRLPRNRRDESDGDGSNRGSLTAHRCSHEAAIREVTPSALGCEECLKIGSDWCICASAELAATWGAVTARQTGT
jgi:hypothetical protein